MATSIDITVETIGHYTRDNDMNLIVADPPRLNRDPVGGAVIPFYSLTTHKYEARNIEECMESLLNFIRENPLSVENKFVTTRQLVASVACGNLKKAIIVSHRNGIFLLPGNGSYSSDSTTLTHDRTAGYQRSGNFHHFMTRKTEVKEQKIKNAGNAFKAVMMTSIEAKEEGNAEATKLYSLLYAAETDALGERDNEHFELKLARDNTDTDWFWCSTSHWSYWQAYFGNVNRIIIGVWSGSITPFLKSLKILNRDEIPRLFEEKKNACIDEKKAEEYRESSWNVETDEKNLYIFFETIKNKIGELKGTGDGNDNRYVAKRVESGTDGPVEWTITKVKHEDKKEVDKFHDVLKEKLPEETGSTHFPASPFACNNKFDCLPEE